MSKLIFPLIVVSFLLIGCKSNSFNNQRYTHFKQVKSPAKTNAVKADLAFLKKSRNTVVERSNNKDQEITPASGNVETSLYSGQGKYIITAKQKVLINSFGKDPETASPGQVRHNLLSKIHHAAKIKSSENKAQRGLLGWLLDTVFGIILFVLVILLIIFLVIVFLV